MAIDSVFYTQEIDLTTAHTNKEITVGLFNWVQFWADGGVDGITVAVGSQSSNVMALNRFRTLPVVWGLKIYVTNDVRAGRSKLLMVFSRTYPLAEYQGGDPVNNAELAARLGSIHTFDRRGEVIFQDDFEDGISKWGVGGDAGYSVAASTAYARSGATSAKLVTGATSGNSAYIVRRLPYPSLAKYGLESHITLLDAAVEYEWWFQLYDGTNLTQTIIRLKTNVGTLAYMDSGGVYQTFATLASLYVGQDLFHAAKLVSNFKDGKFSHFLFNNNVYDLSQYAGLVSASAILPHLYVAIYLLTLANAAKTGYIDDVIVTQNEP